MPAWMMLIFAITFTSGFLLIHYYLWRRLVRDTQLPQPWRRVATAVIWICAGCLVLTLMTSRLTGGLAGILFGWPTMVWLGLAILLFIGIVFVDIARFLRWGTRRTVARLRKKEPEPDFDPERRQLFSRIAGGAVITAAAGTSAIGTYQALRAQTIEEVPITLARLPAALDGFTIVQLTDIHIGLTIARSFIEGIVERANALKPDLIAITGDLVDGSVDTLRDAAAPLADLRAKHGVYFVTGNHEYYSGVDEWLAEITRLGIRVLLNERVSIGTGTDSFDLAGITDLQGARYSDSHKPDLAAALAGRDSSRELVLLAHQPKQVLDTEGHGVGLQLSGHTHGGQIWPWHYLVKLQQRGFLSGLQHHGDTQVYTSRGTGYWGPPLRVGASSEITRIILRSGLRA